MNAESPAADTASPLTAHFRSAHVALQALPDGGAVPIEFSDPLAEHLATRNACGLFDFSFMGAWEFRGSGAADCVARLQSRDPGLLAPGQIAYTLLCRDDGTIFNDATLWKLAADRYWLFSGRKSDQAWIARAASANSFTITRFDAGISMLAMQGPNSGRMLAALIGDEPVTNLAYFRSTEATLCGEPCHLARLGYSGELGYEILVDAGRGPHLWQSLLDRGRQFGLRACGFKAANSLRIESGYILFSAELAKPRLPCEVGLAHLMSLGSTAASTSATRLVCAEVSRSASNADGASVMFELTSSAYSPFAQCTLALGFVDASVCLPGTRLWLPGGESATMCSLPHYDAARLRPKSNPLA
jgi:glycine cleavage system T protein (aminomethyltransferase)